MKNNLIKKICEGSVQEGDLLSGIYILKDGFCVDQSSRKRYTEKKLNELHKKSAIIILPDNGRTNKFSN